MASTAFKMWHQITGGPLNTFASEIRTIKLWEPSLDFRASNINSYISRSLPLTLRVFSYLPIRPPGPVPVGPRPASTAKRSGQSRHSQHSQRGPSIVAWA